MARKKITGQISKRFTLEEVTLIVEAISIFRDTNRRMTTGLFDKDGRMYSNRRRDALNSEELMELMASGEVQLRSVPMGSKLTAEEHDILEELWDVFVAGMGKIEDKIEQNISDTVEENISGVIDDLYTMLKGETK